MANEKDHMAGVLANTLLYHEAAQEGLVKLLWEHMSEEQKQELTDTAFAAAKSRLEKVMEARIMNLGVIEGRGRVNFFARHVEAAVRRAFEAENVTDTINAIVEEQLTATKLGIHDTVTTVVKTMMGSVVKKIVEGVDVYSLQTALRDALKVAG